MKKFIRIVADTNDADYIETFKEISEDDIKILQPLFEAIKNFKPYVRGKYGYEHVHNFPTGDCCRKDLGEKAVEEIYSGNEDALSIFLDEFCPCCEHGIHTIDRIEIIEVESIKRLA